jgi:hypothetical protein
MTWLVSNYGASRGLVPDFQVGTVGLVGNQKSSIRVSLLAKKQPQQP